MCVCGGGGFNRPFVSLRVKAQGLEAALCSFPVSKITTQIHDEVSERSGSETPDS